MTASALTETSPSDVPEDPAPATTRRGWGARLAPVLAVLAGVAAVAVHATRYGHWIVDDAAITFSYARSFADGLGPVLQPGAPPVEGFSDPTWMVLLGVGKLVGLFDHGLLFGIPDYVLFPKALGLLFTGGVLTACYIAAKQIFTRFAWLATLVVGLTLATIPSYVIWVVSGLENSLFAFAVVTLGVTLFVSVKRDKLLTPKVALGAGVIVAFAALTRPEGLIYAGAYPLAALFLLRSGLFWKSFRFALLSVAAFAVPFGAYVVWRHAEFGRLLANPSVAKQQGLPGFDAVKRPFELVAYAGWAGVVVLALVIVFALVKAPWRRPLIALLVPLGLGVVAYGVMVADWMYQHRFASPIWPLAVIAGTLSAGELLRHRRALLRVGVVVVLMGAFVPSGIGFAASADKFADNPNITACLVADRFGRTFNTYADILGLPKASLLLPDLGGSSMTSRLELVDMAGLVNKPIADLVHDNDLRGLRNYVFDTVKPTFIHSWGPWAAGNGIALDPRLDRDYVLIYSSPIEGLRNGDWVRRDVATDPAKLKAAQDYAAKTAPEVAANRFGGPLDDCGPTMKPGQTIAMPG
ncbi:hypothetical protein DMA12_37345 [Amycolatopsis balhimycina DSM 5908]|uniref:Glycosyltransferase RgtA/B/C/D-like domain-containing protein n=1 Tax=Amycolatopsis balhimycina DSM 5908 TaxID=1081091 RepID=A0A428W2B9_AMYBA|nr:hypothetical protein [Amycolatopsis balhimycina]RSM37230.1 hypothetical protein DMA12_37345 [Amycolatopsis balhimycina DSM 5908]